MYFDSKTYKPPPSEDTTGGKAHGDSWEASLLKVGDIDTVSLFSLELNDSDTTGRELLPTFQQYPTTESSQQGC